MSRIAWSCACTRCPPPRSLIGRAVPLILCPVLFAPYKHMADRIGEWLAAVDDMTDDSVRLIVTASPDEVPASLAASPRLHFVGRLGRRADAGSVVPQPGRVLSDGP